MVRVVVVVDAPTELLASVSQIANALQSVTLHTSHGDLKVSISSTPTTKPS